MQKNNRLLSIILILFLYPISGFTQNCLSFGEKRELKLGSLMPYTKVKIGNIEGYFLLDFGTTNTTIDPNGFINGIPKPQAGSTDKFDNFDFYGSWGTVTLNPQNHSNIRGIKQAGILGTDFLSLNIFVLDYPNNAVYRANSGDFCPDKALLAEGFKPISTAGYYTNDLNKLNNMCTPNIPTVPVRIGMVNAVAQIDPGFDDNLYYHSVNINQAFFNSLQEAGIKLEENQKANFSLSTCIAGVNENVKAYKLPAGITFEIMGTDGQPVLINSDANIFLKQTPQQVKSCGGIGTWQIPAAQIGASFLIDAKKVIFDPFKSKVWLYTK